MICIPPNTTRMTFSRTGGSDYHYMSEVGSLHLRERGVRSDSILIDLIAYRGSCSPSSVNGSDR